MRILYWLGLLVLIGAPGRLHAQTELPDPSRSHAAAWRAHPLAPEFALSHRASTDSTSRRPFFLPRPGEQGAYWVGFGAGLALSPLLWCDGCSTVNNAATSMLLGIGGALTGLLLSRTF